MSPKHVTSTPVPTLTSLSLSCLESHMSTLLASIASLQEQYQRQGQEKSVMCANLEAELQAAMSVAQITQYHWDDFQTEDDQLGQGINCSVLACHSTALAGVVLKKGPSLVLADEAKMMRLVSHPCVIRLHGTVHREEKDADYLVIEELGDDLAKVMDYRRLTVREIVVGCHSVAAGLAGCHSRGVVHQDIRPANILLTTDGVHCKVADFGSAAPTHIGSKLNRAQTCMCAIGLESPETARGFLNHGFHFVMPQSDVWQPGLLLLDLTESNRPAAHLHCLNSSQFVEELRQGVQDPRTVPRQKAQLEYLAGLRDAGVPDSAYSDQIAWAVPPVDADDEISAYEEVKAIIRSCLSVQFRVRTTAAGVQKQLGAIMRHRAGPIAS